MVGHLRPEIAAELGLTEEVAVAPGSGDNQMSALGAGAVKEGDWVVSLGTSGTLLELGLNLTDKFAGMLLCCQISAWPAESANNVLNCPYLLSRNWKLKCSSS